jgi:hypothetical protein
MTRDAHVAWRLADEMASALTGREKDAVYLELGSCNHWQAIGRMLEFAARKGLCLPDELLGDVANWLDGYAGNVDEPGLRARLKRLQQPRPGRQWLPSWVR